MIDKAKSLIVIFVMGVLMIATIVNGTDYEHDPFKDNDYYSKATIVSLHGSIIANIYDSDSDIIDNLENKDEILLMEGIMDHDIETVLEHIDRQQLKDYSKKPLIKYAFKKYDYLVDSEFGFEIEDERVHKLLSQHNGTSMYWQGEPGKYYMYNIKFFNDHTTYICTVVLKEEEAVYNLYNIDIGYLYKYGRNVIDWIDIASKEIEVGAKITGDLAVQLMVDCIPPYTTLEQDYYDQYIDLRNQSSLQYPIQVPAGAIHMTINEVKSIYNDETNELGCVIAYKSNAYTGVKGEANDDGFKNMVNIESELMEAELLSGLMTDKIFKFNEFIPERD